MSCVPGPSVWMVLRCQGVGAGVTGALTILAGATRVNRTCVPSTINRTSASACPNAGVFDSRSPSAMMRTLYDEAVVGSVKGAVFAIAIGPHAVVDVVFVNDVSAVATRLAGPAGPTGPAGPAAPVGPIGPASPCGPAGP